MLSASTENQTTKVSLNELPITQDISFVRGDQVDRKFLWTGVAYTSARPKDSSNRLMYHPDEGSFSGQSPTDLVAPWERRFWHSEIRSGYTSTMRYFNGWIPWYGSQPRNWTWWAQNSLVGVFVCDAEYSIEHGGTIVTIALPSAISSSFQPAKSYNWDLESAHPTDYDPDTGAPLRYDTVKTWVSGRAKVSGDWTLKTPLSPGLSA